MEHKINVVDALMRDPTLKPTDFKAALYLHRRDRSQSEIIRDVYGGTGGRANWSRAVKRLAPYLEVDAIYRDGLRRPELHYKLKDFVDDDSKSTDNDGQMPGQMSLSDFGV